MGEDIGCVTELREEVREWARRSGYFLRDEGFRLVVGGVLCWGERR